MVFIKMRLTNFILFILFASCSKGQITINSGGPATVTINGPGPATVTINAPIDYGDTVELYIFSGQSNVGRSRTSEMTGEEAALYAGLIPNSKILNPYLSDSLLYPLNVGVNTMLDDADAQDEFGAEASLLKTLQNENPKYRYLLKYGDGNTSMQAFWSALANRVGWLNLLSYTTNIANAIIAEGKIPVLKAFIWMQGESDAGSESFANNYGWRLQGCFDSFKTHWDNYLTANSMAPQTYKWVVGRIKDIYEFSDTLRAQQQAFCDLESNNAVLIDRDSYPLRDPSHLSATGNILFGLAIKNELD